MDQVLSIFQDDPTTPPATGSGSRLGEAVIIVAGKDDISNLLTCEGVFSAIATCISLFSIWLQLKNYRKPILQRYVVRILLMYVAIRGLAHSRVPLYAIASWWGLKNFTVAAIIDPVRDIYEVQMFQFATDNRAL